MTGVPSSIGRVSDLDDAEEAFKQADARAQELAVMASHELHAAVVSVRRAAEGLLAYHQRLWAANQPRAAAWDRLRGLGGQVPEPVHLRHAGLRATAYVRRWRHGGDRQASHVAPATRESERDG